MLKNIIYIYNFKKNVYTQNSICVRMSGIKPGV